MTIVEAAPEVSEASAGMPSPWEVVLRAWQELDPPEGWRAEIIEGAISIMTPPKDEHSEIIDLIQTRLFREKFREGTAISECTIHQNIDVRVPAHSGLYVPDIVVLPGSVMDRGPEHPADDALLVVEVTSKSAADKDRTAKLRGHAHAGAPVPAGRPLGPADRRGRDHPLRRTGERQVHQRHAGALRQGDPPPRTVRPHARHLRSPGLTGKAPDARRPRTFPGCGGAVARGVSRCSAGRRPHR